MYHTIYLYVSTDQINSTRSNIGFTEDCRCLLLRGTTWCSWGAVCLLLRGTRYSLDARDGRSVRYTDGLPLRAYHKHMIGRFGIVVLPRPS